MIGRLKHRYPSKQSAFGQVLALSLSVSLIAGCSSKNGAILQAGKQDAVNAAPAIANAR